MTDLITEARELCAAATPGPWWYQDKEKWLGHGDRNNYRGGVLANAEYDWEEQEAVLEIKPSDASFIARSRTLIPELCDALEKAEEQNKQLLHEVCKLACESVERDKALARLEAEVMARCAPTADVAPVVRGRLEITDAYPHWMCCSVCHKAVVRNIEVIERYEIPTSFCPNCGAKMEDKP